MKKNVLILLLLLLFCIPAIFPLFHPGFFQSDDGEWMIIRFSAFYQAFRDGQLPVRFLPRLNFEYGYPVANFLYPGFMYLGITIHILGFGFVDTIKIILGSSMVFSAVFCYLWLSRIFNRLPAFAGALFYLYTPYHLYDLYKRGSVGEVLALAVLPFIFWQIERKSLFWTGIGIAFLILSHNTLAFLFLPLLTLYMFLKAFKKKNKMEYAKYTCILGIGFGLSAFFWIPAIYDLQYTKFSHIKVSDPKHYFVDEQLIGASTIVALSATLITLFFYWRRKKKIDKSIVFALLFLLVGWEGIFFSLSISSFFWQILPISFIQFPFRFLSLTIVAVSFLTAFVIDQFKQRSKVFLLTLFVVLLVISAVSHIYPKEYFDKGDSYYATNEDTTTVKNEYMPKWVQEEPGKRPDYLVEPHESISNFSGNSNNMSFKISSKTEIKVVVQKVYFPGWKATVDGKEVQIQYGNPKGLIQIPVSTGDHIVHVYFEEGGIRVWNDIISVVSFIGLIAYVFFLRLNMGKTKAS